MGGARAADGREPPDTQSAAEVFRVGAADAGWIDLSPEPEPEPKSKSKPEGGSAMLAAFVKKHAPSEASKAAESSE